MKEVVIKSKHTRPYVFHIDAGWNLPVAEENIRKLTNKLGVELRVEKMDWEEMKEMQLAWFRTGLEALDVPQDHAFIALIDKLSVKRGVKSTWLCKIILALPMHPYLTEQEIDHVVTQIENLLPGKHS